MQTLRRVFQIVFILLFFLLFLFASYPLESKIPVDFFLRLDPMLAFTSAIASRSIILKSMPAIILVFLTILLGRFFCGWICPLGTTVDGFDNLAKAKSRNKDNSSLRRLRWVKFALLVLILVSALFSLQLVGFLDPISLFTRTTVTVLYPIFVFFIDGFIGFLFSFGFLEEIVFQINELFRGFLLPISSMVFRGSIIIGFIFLGILVLAFVMRRFWCRNLCPLGALLGLFSIIRWYRRHVSDDCTSCKLCRANCRMGAIGPDFKSTDQEECINCMDCQKVCPVNAISFGFVKKPKPCSVDFSRRKFFGAGLAGLLSVGFFKIGFSDPVKKGKVVRPPGARVESEFLDRCVRCGECIRVCSTAGMGLQYAKLESGLEALWAPVLFPSVGYCEYNCNLCGQVCPTGAIYSLSLEKKQQVKIGTAHFNKTRCIPWYYGENCMVCEEHCPVPDKAIKFREERIMTIDGKEADVLLPYVEETLCIGCGICVTRCPVESERGIFLTNAGEERWGTVN